MTASAGPSRALHPARGIPSPSERDRRVPRGGRSDPTSETGAEQVAVGGGEKLRLLLVEDNQPDADFIGAVLADSPVATFDIVVADTLAGALDQSSRERFDVILSDLTLPDSEGLATCLALLDRAPGIPVVVVTAADDLTLGRQAVAAGAEDFITKGQVDGFRLSQLLLFAVERQRQARFLADPLTGLPTRDLFLDRVMVALSKTATTSTRAAVLVVGLALPVGDRSTQLVAGAATRLIGALRPSDTLARIGPLEFAALVEGLVRPVNAERAANRLLGSLVAEIDDGTGTKVRFRAGVGLALGRSGDDPLRLLASAEAALADLRLTDGAGLRWSTRP